MNSRKLVRARRTSRLAVALAASLGLAAGGAVAATDRSPGADLAVLNVEPRPYVEPGSAFEGADRTKNVGSVQISSSVTAYYLSTTPRRGGLDALIGQRAVGALRANEVSSGTAALRLPAGTGGDYYVIACADDTRAVSDGDRSNNCRAAAAPLFASDVARGRVRDATAPAAPAVTLAATGAAAVTGDTLYVRPGAGGGATVTAVSDDAESGVNHVSFPELGAGWTGGGQDPARPYEASYAFDSSAAAPAAPRVRAVNGTGLASEAPFAVVADGTAPTVSFHCGAAPCADAPYQGPVQVTLELLDAGSGIAETRYTLDGSVPSRTNGSRYTGSVQLTATTTIKAVAYDRVGNASPVATRLVTIATARTPAALAPTLDVAAAVTEAVSAQDGGTLSATGRDGTRYILSIPAAALFEDVDVTMTPIATLGGLPLSGGLAAGVDLKPEGLRFAKPARLIMLPAQSPSALETAAFVYDGEGTGFRLHPYTRFVSPWDGSTRIVLELNHFTGAGVGAATALDFGALAENAPAGAEARLEHVSALLAKERDCQLAGTTCVPEEEIRQAIEDGLRTWYADVKAKVDAASSGEDTLLQQALTAAMAWIRAVQLLAASSAEFDAKAEELWAAIARAVDAAKRVEAGRCFAGEFSAIPKLYSLARFEALTGMPEDDLDVHDVIERCLVFEIELDSTFATEWTPYGEHRLSEEVRAVAAFRFRLAGGYDFGRIGRGPVRFEQWRSQTLKDGVVVDCSLTKGDATLGLVVGFDGNPFTGRPGVKIDRITVDIPTTRGTHHWVEESSCQSDKFNVWLHAWKRAHHDEAEADPVFSVPHSFNITTLDTATATTARKTYDRTWSDAGSETKEKTIVSVVHAPEP